MALKQIAHIKFEENEKNVSSHFVFPPENNESISIGAVQNQISRCFQTNKSLENDYQQ